MKRSKYKELCITYKYLTECELNVPDELLVSLSNLIKEEEELRKAKRLKSMSEEDFEFIDDKIKHSVRVTTKDGLIIKGKKNAQTFKLILDHIGLEILNNYNFKIGSHPIIYHDISLKRKRKTKYLFVRPGFFVYSTGSSSNIVKVLRQIDEALLLNLNIELI